MQSKIFSKLCEQHKPENCRLDFEPLIKRLLLHRLPASILKLFELYHGLINCNNVLDSLALFCMIMFSMRDEDLIQLQKSPNFQFLSFASIDDVLYTMSNIFMKPHFQIVHKLHVFGFNFDKIMEIRRGLLTIDELKLSCYSDNDLAQLFLELEVFEFEVPSLSLQIKNKF
eukprot:NODE_65_length_25825_cov_1.353844.p16 type:complete len:171 gc:universal NODE_65_length_25825_cov_1.353844:13820-14332(+)